MSSTAIEVPAVVAGSGEFCNLSTERLEAEITTLAAHLAAATCRWLLMLAEYDQRRGFEQWECATIEQWLSIHAGVAPSTARAHMAVARELGGVPLIRAAFERGELSYSKVRAVCRVATAENETEWVELARHATAVQLERMTTDVRRVAIAEQHDTAIRQLEERSLTVGWTDLGMMRLTATLPPETGALLAGLLSQEIEGEPDSNDGDVEKRSWEQRRADAFAALLGQLEQVTQASEPSEAPRALIVVLRELDGTCRIENGPPIPGEVADELACDCEHATATHSEAGVSFDRRRRHPSRPLRRRIRRRDRCCAFPGCGRTKRLSAHHIKEYAAEGGETTADNLIMLCSFHHGAVHRRGWSITGSPEDGTLQFHDPNGDPYPAKPPVGNADEIPAINADNNVTPDRRTIGSVSGGGRYDHHLTVWALTNNRPLKQHPQPHHRRTAASAEAPTPHVGALRFVSPPAPAEVQLRDSIVFDEHDNIISMPAWPDE
jgi:predicted alpha/beta hydrolase family esterase